MAVPLPVIGRRSLPAALTWLIAPLVLASMGCQDYHWRWDYTQAEQDARQQNKPLFIFYKWWLNDESNRMHGDVLPDPDVSGLFQNSVNVLLEKDSSPEYANYMSKYGVTSPPAFVIVLPDGTYYVAGGFVPKDRFIDFVKNAEAGKSPTGQKTPSFTSKAP